MKISRLVVQEIAHRFLNFVLAVVGVSIAVACLVASVTMIDAGEIQSKQLVAQRQQEVKDAGKKLNDEMRKITKGLGFNIVVLSEDEDIAAFHAEGTPTRTMPEEYVTRLAESPIVVINHLLPIVTKKIEWAEEKQKIVLTGTRGEVPQIHRDPKKPLLDRVPSGKVVLGYRLHQPRKLKPGSKIVINGREFEVAKCHAERGTVDDITAWVNLVEAQQMLGMQNLVNAILALECNCATADRLAEIRGEIAKVLPGTQVLERGPKALARAEARNKAKKAAEVSLVAAQESGQQMINSRKAQTSSQRACWPGCWAMANSKSGLALSVWWFAIARLPTAIATSTREATIRPARDRPACSGGLSSKSSASTSMGATPASMRSTKPLSEAICSITGFVRELLSPESLASSLTRISRVWSSSSPDFQSP